MHHCFPPVNCIAMTAKELFALPAAKPQFVEPRISNEDSRNARRIMGVVVVLEKIVG